MPEAPAAANAAGAAAATATATAAAADAARLAGCFCEGYWGERCCCYLFVINKRR